MEASFLQSWFVSADQPFPVADLFMVKVICQSKCVRHTVPQKAAFGPSGDLWEERYVPCAGPGWCSPGLLFFLCRRQYCTKLCVCHLLGQKVGSWQTRTVAVPSLCEMGARTSCRRWALKGSFACLVLLKTRPRGRELLVFRGTSILACSCCFAISVLPESAPCAPISCFSASVTLHG